MRFERFRQIIEHNRNHQVEMTSNVRELYHRMHLDYEKDILNLEFILRPLFEQEDYLILEMPFRDQEVGAICYKGDYYGYIFLNSAVPKVNVNFALGHEIYHVFYQKQPFRNKVELRMSEDYHGDADELCANLFSGMLLMPTSSFVSMFNKFQTEQEEHDTELTMIVKLMSCFQMPYMAVVIRCYELELLPEGEVLRQLIETEHDFIQDEFDKLWLDKRILKATYRDNYPRLEQIVKNAGKICESKGILKGQTVEKAIQNIAKLYEEIRREHHEYNEL